MRINTSGTCGSSIIPGAPASPALNRSFTLDDYVAAANGAGKSALLDLVQYVLLGGERQFNRTAAGNPRGRDLVG
jgi:hypothetical protein